MCWHGQQQRLYTVNDNSMIPKKKLYKTACGTAIIAIYRS